MLEKNIEALFLPRDGRHPDARAGCDGLLSSTGAGAGALAVLQALPDVGLLAAVKSRLDAERRALGVDGAHGRGWDRFETLKEKLAALSGGG